MKKMILLAFAAAVSITIPAEARIFQNDKEMRLAISQTEEVTGSLVGLDYYLFREFSIGFNVGFYDYDCDFDQTARTFGIGFDLRYNFNPEGYTIPYLGGQLNYLEEHGDVMYGPLIGVKHYIYESANLFLEYQPRFKDDNSDDDIDHALVFGFAFKL